MHFTCAKPVEASAITPSQIKPPPAEKALDRGLNFARRAENEENLWNLAKNPHPKIISTAVSILLDR
ncbi:MAG: hypothetical protein JXA07_04730, partial [Spirochaetes bacterium]|nr:hypothetical protein [Spirochaetota bacterium]